MTRKCQHCAGPALHVIRWLDKVAGQERETWLCDAHAGAAWEKRRDSVRRATEPLTRGITAAGSYRISARDPESLTNAQLLAEYERLSTHSSAISRDMINCGRGAERPSDRVGKTDDLSRMDAAISARMSTLAAEHAARSRNGGRRIRMENGGVRFCGGVPEGLRWRRFEP